MAISLDLNAAGITTDTFHGKKLGQYRRNCSTPGIDVLFHDLEGALIKQINQADVVVGCVAWLTSFPILRALRRKKAVALVVQKEDFLRPDLGAGSSWKHSLRAHYDALPTRLNRLFMNMPEPLSEMSCAHDPTIHAVRCVGNYNRDKKPAFPRMHHKFIVLCKLDQPPRHQWATEEWDDGEKHRCEWCGLYREKQMNRHDEQAPSLCAEAFVFKPYAVWTGSFNFTANAAYSLENALLIRTPEIVEVYFNEWAVIEAISERLDWDSIWVAPQWRIGT
jgi:hypothetical protein